MERKIRTMYFSATDTTKNMVNYIAEQIAEEMETAVEERFDFTLPRERTGAKEFGEDDVVIFGVPVYAGRVPNVLLKYLDTVRGNGALAVPVVLFGNRDYDDGLIELRNILEKDGFHTIAAAAFVGEHSFSRELAAGRPDEADFAQARVFAGRVAEKLAGGVFDSPIAVKGQTPLRPYYQPRDRKGNPVDIRKVLPKVKDSCTHCGLCAELCPMGSIDPQDVSAYRGICIKCGACIKKCPEGARYYDDGGYLYHQHELEEGYRRRAEPDFFA